MVEVELGWDPALGFPVWALPSASPGHPGSCFDFARRLPNQGWPPPQSTALDVAGLPGSGL